MDKYTEYFLWSLFTSSILGGWLYFRLINLAIPFYATFMLYGLILFFNFIFWLGIAKIEIEKEKKELRIE